jgi:hypothetical protein
MSILLGLNQRKDKQIKETGVKSTSLRNKLSASFQDFTTFSKGLLSIGKYGKFKSKEKPSSSSTRKIIINGNPLLDPEGGTDFDGGVTPLICPKKGSSFMFAGSSSKTIAFPDECDLSRITAPSINPLLNTPRQNESDEDLRQKLLAKILEGTGFSEKFNEKYQLCELLGDGAFGFVFAAISLETNKEVLSL